MSLTNISTLCARCLKGREYLIRHNSSNVNDFSNGNFHVVREDDPSWSGTGALFVILDDKDPISLEYLMQQKRLIETEEAFQQLRTLRNSLITETDHLMVPDYPIKPEDRDQLLAYRQALRDLPASQHPTLRDDDGTLKMTSVVFPTKPPFLRK